MRRRHPSAPLSHLFFEVGQSFSGFGEPRFHFRRAIILTLGHNCTCAAPHFIAAHARNARGRLNRVIAFIMARETWRQNLRVMDALGIEQSDRILDVGCGHGRSLAELATRAARGRVVGVDPSELMVEDRRAAQPGACQGRSRWRSPCERGIPAVRGRLLRQGAVRPRALFLEGSRCAPA